MGKCTADLPNFPPPGTRNVPAPPSPILTAVLPAALPASQAPRRDAPGESSRPPSVSRVDVADQTRGHPAPEPGRPGRVEAEDRGELPGIPREEGRRGRRADAGDDVRGGYGGRYTPALPPGAACGAAADAAALGPAGEEKGAGGTVEVDLAEGRHIGVRWG